MYFVRYGEVVRVTGKKTRVWDHLPDSTYAFDYDDSTIWSVKKLKSEQKRLENAGFDGMEALCAVEAELNRREYQDEAVTMGSFDDAMAYLDDMEELADEEWDAHERKPVILLEDLTMPEKKLIRDLASIERKSISIQKAILGGSETDGKLLDRAVKLEDRAGRIVLDLMTSEFAARASELEDPVESMKEVAAALLFLYAQERSVAELHGETPDEDYFYAGNFLYSRAVIAQMAQEDEADEPSDPDDGEDEDEENGILHQLFPADSDDLPF